MDNFQIYTDAREQIEAVRQVSQLVDEVAICFPTLPDLVDFVEEATRNGLEHFNSVPYDTMKRQDRLGESFGVRFEFLRYADDPWRIEAMCVIDGHAPLHRAALHREQSAVVIHMSYKMATLHDYQEEVRRLRSEVQMEAEYANSYGIFSYWPGPNGRVPYVKPRVNLRDQ